MHRTQYVRSFVLGVAALFVLALVFKSAGPVRAQGPIPIQDAVKQGIIEVELQGSGDPFWQDSIAYQIMNQRETPVTILVPSGLVLEPDDDSYQGLVIGKDYTIALCGSSSTPGPSPTSCADSTVEGKWNGFCVNLSRHAPDESTTYHVGSMASGPLLQVVQSIQHKGASGRLGAQLAVWRVTDNFTLESLGSSDQQASELVQTIMPFLGLARPEIDLAQGILEDSGTGLKFYSGTPPPNLFDPGGLLAPGSSTGVPQLDDFKRQVENAVVTAGIIGGLALCSCLVVGLGLIGAIAYFVIRR